MDIMYELQCESVFRKTKFIQIENNFAGYTNAVYNGDYVLLKENDKQYKIKFTFDKELNVIYSKHEL